MSNEIVIAMNHARSTRLEAVAAGALPHTREFALGLPFARSSAERDFQLWTAAGIEHLELIAETVLGRALEKCALRFNLTHLKRCSAAAADVHEADICTRLLWYRLAAGDTAAPGQLAAIVLRTAANDKTAAPWAISVALPEGRAESRHGTGDGRAAQA